MHAHLAIRERGREINLDCNPYFRRCCLWSCSSKVTFCYVFYIFQINSIHDIKHDTICSFVAEPILSVISLGLFGLLFFFWKIQLVTHKIQESKRVFADATTITKQKNINLTFAKLWLEPITIEREFLCEIEALFLYVHKIYCLYARLAYLNGCGQFQ